MRFDQVRIPLTPRSVLRCLDLGISLCGRNLLPLFALLMTVSLPILLLVGTTAVWFPDEALVTTFASVYFATAILGCLEVRFLAKTLFGDTVTPHQTICANDPPIWKAVLRVLGGRIACLLAALLCVVPGLLLMVRWGFWSESRVLRGLEEHRPDRRTGELVKQEYSELVFRAGALTMAWLLMAGLLFITADCATTLLFGHSILLGRFDDVTATLYDDPLVEEILTLLVDLLTTDPWVLTTAVLVLLISYLPVRAAWLLCYVDLRVRRDCWDVELAMLEEKNRLALPSPTSSVTRSSTAG